MTWRLGEVIDGRYAVLEVHEDGGMGVVYRVRHLVWDIDLAVKSPRPDLFRSTKDQRRFIAEAETWVSLGLHPHVCNCYYVRVLDGVPRVFAEYVPGGHLREWINNRRLYDGDPPEVLARILDIAIQTAWGLDHAHGHGLVHRDVKPANVLLDLEDDQHGEHGTVTAKITDFGLARARGRASPTTVSPDGPPGTGIPVSNGDAMTPRYASPEQVERLSLGRGTDIYSFAVSVLEMCAGEATWMTGPAAGDALIAYRAGDAAGAVAIPAALGGLLEWCLQEEPDDRPDSMAGVAAELIDIYQGVTGGAYPRPAPASADLRGDEFNNRAVSLLDLDRRAEADELFARALAADPQHARARYNAGVVRWRRGAVTDDALLDEIEATRADTGDPWDVRYTLAEIHLERGNLDTARELLDDLARERPDEPEILEAQRKVRSGEIVNARRVQESRVPWPPRPPSQDLWAEATNTVPDQVPLTMTPDGRLLLAGGWDGVVRLYDVRSGRCLRTLKRHRRPVSAVDLTPDGRFAVSVCRDETVRFWDLTARRFGGSAKGRILYAAAPDPPSCDDSHTPRSGDTTIRLTADGRLVLYTGPEGAFRVWDVRTGRLRIHDEARADQLVEVSADGRRALSVRSLRLGSDREDIVRLWDLPDGRCLRELHPGHKPSVESLCFGADGRYAVTGGLDHKIRVWDLADDRCVRVLASPTAPSTLSLSADARWLLSGSQYENAVRLWDLKSGRCLRTFHAHRGGTTVVHLDADARYGLTAGQDGMVRRWELPGDYRGTPLLSRPRPHVELSRLGGRVDALVAEAERAMAAGRFPAALDLLRQARAVPGYERAPRVMSAWWALGRRAVRTRVRAAWSSRFLSGQAEVLAVDLTGDGGTAVSGHRDGTVRLWDLDGGTCLWVLEGHTNMVESVCLSVDGRRALTSSRDGTVRLWNVADGGCQHVLHPTRGMLGKSLPVRFSVDGGQAVVGGAPIQVWDLTTGDLTRGEQRRMGGGFDDDMCVGVDGRLVATASGNAADVQDLAGGRLIHEFRSGFVPTMRSVSLSADGRSVLTGEDDGLRLWDTATGAAVRTFGDPPARGFHTVRMTADGRFAVTGGYWSYPAVWEVGSGRRTRVLDGHEQGVASLALTPDGRFVLAGHGDTLRLWELDWELAARDAADWDDGAAPYLDMFLRRHGHDGHGHGARWTSEDFYALLRLLQDAGYGWLRADGARAQLDRVSADRGAGR